DQIPNVENVTGSPLDDLITEDSGDNTITGGAGTDTLSYAPSAAGVTVDLVAGTGTGDGADTLATVENLIGSSHDDTLSGGDTANKLVGGDGDDALSGGAGTDTADYSGVDGGVDANLGTGVATGEGTDSLDPSIENLLGGMGDDTLGSSSA